MIAPVVELTPASREAMQEALRANAPEVFGFPGTDVVLWLPCFGKGRPRKLDMYEAPASVHSYLEPVEPDRPEAEGGVWGEVSRRSLHYGVSGAHEQKLRLAYPRLDVMASLLNMRQWLVRGGGSMPDYHHMADRIERWLFEDDGTAREDQARREAWAADQSATFRPGQGPGL